MKKSWEDEGQESSSGKKLAPEDKSSLLVRVIEDNTEKLHETLGITLEDSRRLQKIINDMIEADHAREKVRCNVSALMVEVSKHCTHANQLAFACFAMGRILSKVTNSESKGRNISLSGVITKKDGKIISIKGEDGEDIPEHIKKILREILGREGLDDDENLDL